MSELLKAKWDTLKMCEWYLNKTNISINYYTKLRRKALKGILKLQLMEFNRT